MNSLHIKRAIQICEKGGVIAYPTEAVFGLGCLPLNEKSVHKILELKDRSIKKGLILVSANIKQLEEFVDFSMIEDTEPIYSSWPGPVTWIVPVLENIPEWLTGEHDSLAVRVSSNPVVQSLCEQLGPIVSTSANPESLEPAKTNQQVRMYFGEAVDYVIPANISNTLKPTEIRHAQTGKIIRQS